VAPAAVFDLAFEHEVLLAPRKSVGVVARAGLESQQHGRFAALRIEVELLPLHGVSRHGSEGLST
jgi:hypothetical protein